MAQDPMTNTTTIPVALRAYNYTKDRILQGELVGGQLLNEVQICETLGVSRTPVHEAFLRLAAERLLTLSSRQGAGAVVTPMSPQETRDVLDTREAIESVAARRLTESGPLDTQTVSAFEEILQRQRTAVEAHDVSAFIEADDEFHSTVVERSGNGLALHLFSSIRDRQQRLRFQLLTIRSEHLAPAITDHIELLRHLSEADGDGYTEALKRHLIRYQGAL
jgi:DNA-binding GntR family transcriptional regulator